MNLFAYARDNLAGAWQVLLGRSEGLSRLDTSIDGFWRSFAAVILLAPFALLSLIGPHAQGPEGGEAVEPFTAARLAIYGVALLADWVAFPLVFALVAPVFGLGSRYVPYIVARNWASVIIGAMVALIHVPRILNILPAEITPYLLLIGLGVALRFSYVLVRTTLAVSMAMALPIVILDFLVSLVVWSIFDRLA
jgi:hypothetical protein